MELPDKWPLWETLLKHFLTVFEFFFRQRSKWLYHEVPIEFIGQSIAPDALKSSLNLLSSSIQKLAWKIPFLLAYLFL